jgi:hypothetical protein
MLERQLLSGENDDVLVPGSTLSSPTTMNVLRSLKRQRYPPAPARSGLSVDGRTAQDPRAQA